MKLKKLLLVCAIAFFTLFSLAQSLGLPPDPGTCDVVVEGHYELIGFSGIMPIFVYIPTYCAQWTVY